MVDDEAIQELDLVALGGETFESFYAERFEPLSRRVAERTPGDARPPVELDTDALAVRSVITELPDRDREVIVLRYYLDLPVSEIADQLSMPLGTVKSLIHRATNRLRSALTEETIQ